MLLGHLRISHGESPQSRIHDEFSCEIPLRPLKGAARAGIFQGLLGNPLFLQLLHPFPDLHRISLLQGKLHFQHHQCFFLDPAGAIAQLQLRRRILPHVAIPVDGFHPDEHVLHLAAIGPGIHRRRAAYGSRNAGCKLQTGQPFSRCSCCSLSQKRPRLHIQVCSFYPDTGIISVNLQHHAAHAAVPHQEIAAVADDRAGNVLFPADL